MPVQTPWGMYFPGGLVGDADRPLSLDSCLCQMNSLDHLAAKIGNLRGVLWGDMLGAFHTLGTAAKRDRPMVSD